MGATTFLDVNTGTDLNEAFREAVNEAQYQHGHGGYSGTIAEKHDVVLVGKTASYDEALTLAHQMLNDDDPRISDKWGPAGAIAYDDEVPGWVFFGWASE